MRSDDRRRAVGGRAGAVRQHETHLTLLRVSRAAPLVRARIDAIVVPAARHARHLDYAIRLAKASGAMLLVLCSREARVEDVRQRMGRVPGTRGIVVEVPEGYGIPGFTPLSGSDDTLRKVSFERRSDLSVKRNLGLLLGRRLGYRRIVFVDDDIRGLRPADIGRLASTLDGVPVAAMASSDFPDNSVVCHANRLSGARQGVFVSGSVLAVDCARVWVPFFPDVYNEDWFFFHEYLRTQEVGYAGTSRQLEYDPFRDPDRARREEFGDLVAEGLFARLDDGLTHTPGEGYWRDFHEVRAGFIDDALARLESQPHDPRAVDSLKAAREQLGLITPDVCALLLDLMEADRAPWQDVLKQSVPRDAGRHTVADAMVALELSGFETAGV